MDPNEMHKSAALGGDNNISLDDRFVTMETKIEASLEKMRRAFEKMFEQTDKRMIKIEKKMLPLNDKNKEWPFDDWKVATNQWKNNHTE